MEASYFNVEIPLKDGGYLIYNSISKIIVRLSSDDRHDYDAGLFDDPYYSSWMILRDKQMLVKSKEEQLTRLKSNDILVKKTNPSVMSLTLMMSESCNFSCSYCNQGQNKEKAVLTREVINQVVSYVGLQSGLSELNISWYGGEPLLSYDKILEYSGIIKEFCESSGIAYKGSIVTNGYLLTSKRAKGLLGVGISLAQVTLDGSRIDHNASRFANSKQDSYEIIMRNISDTLENTGLSIALRVNVTRSNSSGLYSLIDDIKLRSLDHKRISIYFAAVYDPSLSEITDCSDVSADLVLQDRTYALKELDLLKYADNRGLRVALDIDEHEGDCLVTRSNSFAIDPKGNLFKCYIPITNKQYSVGNITAFDGVYSNKTFLKWDSWTAFSQDGCKNCKLLGSCRGGCPLHFVSESHKNLGSHCPTSKYAFNEHIFRRAVLQGLADELDWDEELSVTKSNSLMFYPAN